MFGIISDVRREQEDEKVVFKKSFGRCNGGFAGYQRQLHYIRRQHAQKNLRDLLSDFPKVYEGDSKSFEVSGKMILPVQKTGESYLVIRRQDSNLEYDDSFIYFKLK